MEARPQAHGTDPLEGVWHGRFVVLLTAGAVLVSLVVSAAGGTPPELPGIALDSPALLHLERALVVGAVIAGSSIFLIRGWAGYFPSKLSTTGAEYANWSTVERVEGVSQVATSAVEALRGDQLAINRTMFGKLNEVQQELRQMRDSVYAGGHD
jgi:hypothetical protein